MTILYRYAATNDSLPSRTTLERFRGIVQPERHLCILPEALGDSESCAGPALVCYSHLPMPFTAVKGSDVLCLGHSLEEVIQPGKGVGIIYLPSIQKRMLPSFLGNRTTGLLYSLVEDSMTPSWIMRSTSSFSTGISLSGIRYILCLIGVGSFRWISCITTVEFQAFPGIG